MLCCNFVCARNSFSSCRIMSARLLRNVNITTVYLMNIYDALVDIGGLIKTGFLTTMSYITTILAIIAVAGGFLYVNAENFLTWIASLQSYVETVQGMVVSIPAASVVGYANRVFPITEWMALLGVIIALKGIALTIRLTKTLALWWSGA